MPHPCTDLIAQLIAQHCLAKVLLSGVDDLPGQRHSVALPQRQPKYEPAAAAANTCHTQCNGILVGRLLSKPAHPILTAEMSASTDTMYRAIAPALSSPHNPPYFHQARTLNCPGSGSSNLRRHPAAISTPPAAGTTVLQQASLSPHLQLVWLCSRFNAAHTSSPGACSILSWLAPPTRMIGDDDSMLKTLAHAATLLALP